MSPVVGPIGRLGRFTATHTRSVVLAWVAIAVAFGFFAPRVETALSGAGWQANGSESVQARGVIQHHFAGQSSTALMVVVHSARLTASDPAFAAVVASAERILRSDPAITSALPPRAGVSLSHDGHTAIVMGGAARNPTQMVAAADRLKGKLHAAGSADVSVNATGASAMWSDFNTANRTAMMRSELFSWPVTLAILVLAFGSLVAAGLPLMLTITGLVASAGVLALAAQVADVSIWAMNFALMFALALGIDYALFIVARYRAALFGSHLSPVEATAVTMDTAGKAVLFSGATVLISLTAVMLVPSPAFRSMALGIMVSVLFVLAAALTLLPAVLAWLGPRVDRLSLPLGALRRAPLPPLRRLGRAALAPPAGIRWCSAGRAPAPRRPHRRPSHRDAVDQGGAHQRHLSRRLHTGGGRVRPGGSRFSPSRRTRRRPARRRARPLRRPGDRRDHAGPARPRRRTRTDPGDTA